MGSYEPSHVEIIGHQKLASRNLSLASAKRGLLAKLG